jgi:hypothetical protein
MSQSEPEPKPESDPSLLLPLQGFAKHSSGPIYERVYDVSPSHDGTKGQIISNPQTTGQNVFVCDSKSGNVIRTIIKGDERCADCNTSHTGFIELPQHWIGKKVLCLFQQPFCML